MRNPLRRAFGAWLPAAAVNLLVCLTCPVPSSLELAETGSEHARYPQEDLPG